MKSKLFSPISIGEQIFENRIAVSPMCQYSANAGSATDWHRMHLGTLAGSGAGLVMLEATAVECVGRITHGCLGLYSDANELALSQVMSFCRSAGLAKFGIQLSHAGRKGSYHVPWEGGGPLKSSDDPWSTLAPSVSENFTASACTDDDLNRIKHAFVQSAVRAVRIGFEVLEVHAAHGYLLHQFLSPLSNKRTDQYGGNLENRMRFTLEIFDLIRRAVPSRIVVGARITGTDWLEGGIQEDEAIAFARALENIGCNYVDVTTGGLLPVRIPVGPGYQVKFAATIKKNVRIPVRAIGMIATPQQAEEIITSGSADAVAIARAFIDNPHWPYEAARVLGHELSYPKQYARAHPKLWPGSQLKG